MYLVCVLGGVKPQGVSKGCCWGSSPKRNMHHPWLSSWFGMRQIESHQTSLSPLHRHTLPQPIDILAHPNVYSIQFSAYSQNATNTLSPPCRHYTKKVKHCCQEMSCKIWKSKGLLTVPFEHIYYGITCIMETVLSWIITIVITKKRLIIMSQTLWHHPQSTSFQWEAARWARGKMSGKP